MKVFTGIFAILIFCLNLSVCDDLACGEHAEETAVTAFHLDDCGDTNEGHADHCSPFCVCSCCSTLTFVPQNTLLSEFQAVAFEQPAFISILSSQFSGEIWIPPKHV